MMRSSAYNRFGVLMGTSWPASCPRWYGLREDSLPMITLFPSQGDFYATAVDLIPPGPRALESHMTNELVGRFNAPTAQWIAPAAELAIGGAPPVLIEILPPVCNRLGRFV